MQTKTCVLALSFMSHINQKITINIPRAKDDMTATEIRNGMDGIIANGIIMYASKGRPVSIFGAELIETELEKIL